MKRFFIALAVFFVTTTSIAVAADTGSKADIAAVRALQLKLFPHDKIDQVHVIGDYAMFHVYNLETTAHPVYERISGEKWKRIMPGAETTMSLSGMVYNGVPSSVARSLCAIWGPHNTPCMDFH
jgi:hypothetical protein